MTIEYIYSDRYLDWRLGERHPTHPERAKYALDFIHDMGVPMKVVEPTEASEDELRSVHSADYIADVKSGYSDEWTGCRPELHAVASLMAGGTIQAAHRILDGATTRAFNPQGAKHHAHHDHASGFCVYNDMAIAAHMLADAGLKVFYLDWDAHHGDGVEALTADRQDILTASIHNIDNFPGTGSTSIPNQNVYNFPLRRGTGGDDMVTSVDKALNRAADFEPDIVLLAAGADGHSKDPLGGLQYETEHFLEAARRVDAFSHEQTHGKILVGGAGGYRHKDWTPRIWAEVFAILAGQSSARAPVMRSS